MATKFVAWRSRTTTKTWFCLQCRHTGLFIQKDGLDFVTLANLIPLFPVGQRRRMVQCPSCKALFDPHTVPHSGASTTSEAPTSAEPTSTEAKPKG